MKSLYYFTCSKRKCFSEVNVGNYVQQYASTFSQEYVGNGGKYNQAPAMLHYILRLHDGRSVDVSAGNTQEIRLSMGEIMPWKS